MSALYGLALNIGLALLVWTPAVVRYVYLPARRERV